MSRRNLDIIIATGGAMFAILVAVLGVVAWNEANFAKDNIRVQLAEQQIELKSYDKLTERERTVAGIDAVAGKQITNGEQAKVYAGYIKVHLEDQATTAGYPGATYATIGTPQSELRAKAAQAKAAGDTAAAADFDKQLTAVTNLRDNMFKGETLRGMLLTTYGFGVLGERAALAAYIAFGIAAVAGLLAVAGFIHALATPKERTVFGGVFAPAPTR